MRHHIGERSVRRAAADFAIEAREASREGRAPPRVEPAIAAHEATLERFYEEVDRAGGVLRHAASMRADPAAFADGSSDARLRIAPRRGGRARTGALAVAALALAIVKLAPLLSGPAKGPAPERRVQPALAGVPLEAETGGPLVEAAPPPSAEPIMLRVQGLESVLFALGRERLSSAEGHILALDSDVFCDEVLPRLDPVDQWRVHQAALASLGHYPADRIDGLYGEQTERGLAAFFSGRPAGRIVSGGLLNRAAARELLGEVDRIALALPGREPAAGGTERFAARTGEEERETESGTQESPARTLSR